MQPVKPPASIRHLLVCTNERDPATGKPSCGLHGSPALREQLKKAVKERGLKGRLKVTAVGCLDYCPAQGVAVGFYPENEFFIADLDEIDALWARLTDGVPVDTG
jgi:predicted metal-binding protein